MSRARVLIKSRFNRIIHQGLNRYFHKTILTMRNINFNLFEATKKEKKNTFENKPVHVDKGIKHQSSCCYCWEYNLQLLSHSSTATGRHNPELVFIFWSYVLLVMLDFIIIIIINNVVFRHSLYISRLILRVLKLIFM
jgi:hypothetical protein